MKTYKVTGQTCVGELRLASLDVGYDIRANNEVVYLPTNFKSVGFDYNGETYLVIGTREEMIAAITSAGYQVATAAT